MASGLVDITDFGAVGDGRTDNRDAIQAAVDYARANGKGVFVPDGIFQHRGTINLRDVTVVGNGTASVLKAFDSTDQALIVTGEGSGLRNLTLDSDATERSSRSNGAKVLISSATHFTVENVAIVNSSAAGILIYGSAHGVVQNNALRHTMADAIHLTAGTNDVVVRANRIDHAGDDGISVVSYESTGMTFNITITGNQVVDNDWGRNISVVGGSQIRITNNFVSGNAAGLAGIYLASEGSFDTFGVTDVTVTGNTVLNTGSATTGHGNIMLYDGTDHSLSGIVISGNFVQGLGIRSIGSSISADLLDNQVNSVAAAPSAPPVPAPAQRSGNLVLTGSIGSDELRGGGGNDTLSSGGGDDRLYGGAGDDSAQGNQGADALYGGDGLDTLFGGQEGDTLSGGDGNDLLLGNLGDDLVLAEGGNDTVWGGQQNDVLYGDAGDDWLSGDRGDDTLTGGTGADRFFFTAGGGNDLITDFSFADGDRLVVPAGAVVTFGMSANGDAALSLAGFGTIVLAGVPAGQADAGWIVS